MRPGVKVEDIVVGTGDEAVRSKVSVINLRMFLPDGTELPEGFMPRSRLRISPFARQTRGTRVSCGRA